MPRWWFWTNQTYVVKLKVLLMVLPSNHSSRSNGFLVNIVTKIENYQRFVVNNNVMALGDSILDITIIAEVKDILFTSMKRLRIFFHYCFSSHYCTDWWRVQLDHKGTRPEPTHVSIEFYVIIILTRHECFDVPLDIILTHTHKIESVNNSQEFISITKCCEENVFVVFGIA